MSALLPADKRDLVENGLRAAFGTTTLEGIEPLGQGLSSALVYRIVVGGRAYLLRIVTRVDALTDPKRHLACMTIAAEAGLAPAIHYAAPADGLIITDFVAGRPLAVLGRPRTELLHDLAAAVRRLQASAPFPAFVDYFDGVDQLIGEVAGLPLLPAAAAEVFERYAAIPAAYPRGRTGDPAELVSSHNDLNPGNTLWDGQRLWIVDWEAAFLNDRYVDPAWVCNFFATRPEDEDRFLTAYFGAPPTQHQGARLFLMRQVCQMLFAVVMIRLGATRRPDLRVPTAALQAPTLGELRPQMAGLLATAEGQIQVGVTTLGEVLRNTRTARFDEALRMVRG